MAYQALYRKYRPVTFDDVVGQDIVVNTLKNALKIGKTSHAYMFSGPRGTGKTTIAKILAKSLNCLSLENGLSCGHCQNCVSIMSNECTDIIEIDAASNNGVDEIREIKNNINLVPSELKYKVYIIDEVHMLSIGAFNALLKTLEEPPEHIVFILATTDPQKVPITIVSRCQCFEFKRISDEMIVKRLSEVCSLENIDVDKNVLEKIAYISDGGMRDALGLLDKVNSYANGKITIEDFNEINGLVGDDYKIKFISSVHSKNVVDILNQIEYLHSSGKDIVVFCQELMDVLRKKMIDFYVSGIEEYPISFIISFIECLNKLIVNLKASSNLRIMFETSILSYLSYKDYNYKSEIDVNDEKNDVDKNINDTLLKEDKNSNSTIQKLDKNTSKSISNISNVSSFDISIYKSVIKQIIINTFSTAKKEYLMDFKNKWGKLNDFVFDPKFGAVACYLIDATLAAVGDKDLILFHNFDDNVDRGISMIPSILALISKCFEKDYRVALVTKNEWDLEKKNYISDKSKGVVYNYQDIDLLNFCKNSGQNSGDNDIIKEDDIVAQAINLFGADVVKIQE